MQKILCFGEILLRMTPDKDWTHNQSIQAFIGGAEVNVALALACWNVPVKISTSLPDNFIADNIIRFFREKKIDTSAISKNGKRIGIYYLNQGADLKSAGVVYDRSCSSFAELSKGDIDWNETLKDVSHVHFTAITPAISQNVADLCEEMLQAAAAKKITISLDLNFRDKLWKYGKLPVEIMPNLAKYCDIIMGNIWSANKLLGIGIIDDIDKKTLQEDFLDQARNTSEAIIKQFPKCTTVANTFRFNMENNAIKYFATLYKKNASFVFSKEQLYSNIIDKAGSGDCFMAGLLFGFYKKKTLQQIINYAVTAATGKLYERGDFTQQSIESIEQKITSNE